MVCGRSEGGEWYVGGVRVVSGTWEGQLVSGLRVITGMWGSKPRPWRTTRMTSSLTLRPMQMEL